LAYLACRTECCIVKSGKIFLDSTTACGRRQTPSTLDAIAVTGIGPD